MSYKRNIPFSERVGAVTPRVQVGLMDNRLSNDLYNYIWIHYFRGLTSQVRPLDTDDAWSPFSKQTDNFRIVWIHFLSHPVTDLQFYIDVSNLESAYNRFDWYDKYDFLEFCLNKLDDVSDSKDAVSDLNDILLQNNSGYRCIDNKFVTITSEIEAKSIDAAIESTLDEGHLQSALNQLALRENVNYNIVASESISAVESALGNIVKKMAPEKYQRKDTLGSLINVLKSESLVPDHPAFIESWKKLYGYLSDSGIRHGNAEGENHQVEINEAMYLLSICSAFVNYLKGLCVKY